MDISVNKVVKSFIHARFSEWYAEQVTEQFYKGDDDPVDLSALRMKCLGAQWIEALYEHLTNNPHVTVNGFQHAVIFTALGLLDNDTELANYGEMSTEFDYDLSGDQQSQGEHTDSEGELSHEDQTVHTKVPLSVEDVFMRTEDSD